jgi:hypothetical protein
MELFSIVLAVGTFVMGKLQGHESGYKKAQQEALERQAQIDVQKEWERNFKHYMDKSGGDDE